ncbi:MAG TPA: ABC transporter permease [Vicinamibacterales bacterium]|nr:ABC transporter permease [Vicinamibacterales bacterium]
MIERLYALLLYAYPPDLRRAHAAEMRQCARAALAARGAAAVPRLFADLFFTVPREWLHLLKGFPMAGIGRDVAYAVRLLWRSPGFTIAAVLTLALGIGANTAIFTLADATLLRPFKVAAPSQLVVFKWTSAYPDYLDYAKRSDLFTGVAAVATSRLNVVAGDAPELTDAAFVSGNYFGVLGVPAAAGRVLGAPDDVRNGPLVGVLDHAWWRARLHGDPSVVGRTIQCNGQAVTIVGVARAGFRGTSLRAVPTIYLPVNTIGRVAGGMMARPGLLAGRDFVWLSLVARLRDGVPAATAAAAIDALYTVTHPSHDSDKADAMELTPLKQRALGGAAGAIYTFIQLLGAVVGITLLIGCANLANLQLARGAARRREIAVRMAIGAGRGRIVRQLLIESLVLAVVGGGFGLYVAALTLQLIARFQLPGGIEIAGLDLGVNRAALIFTALVACGTAVAFGLAPAWRAARGDALGSIREEGRATSARSGLRATLVAAQVALSLVLLVGTGLFLRSLVYSLRLPLGYSLPGVATATANLAIARYDARRTGLFYDEVLTRVRQHPGVTAAAWTTILPVNGDMVMATAVEGYTKAPKEQIEFHFASVSPQYFNAAGTRLLRGRAFTDGDTASSPGVGIINETAARKYWAGRDPLQGRLGGDRPIQIVGIVEDTRIETLDETPEPFVYRPLAQPAGPFGPGASTLVVRTAGEAQALLPLLRESIRAVDPAVPVSRVNTFAWQVRELVMPQRMGATLFGVFAALALLLAAIGIYGVASYVAQLRTREIGIRIALGADRRRIRALVLRQGAAPVAAGLAAGLVIAAVTSRLAATFLRGVEPRDPLTYATVAALLALVAIGATWLPARRASALDPIRALRQE